MEIFPTTRRVAFLTALLCNDYNVEAYMAKLIEVNSANFEAEVIKSGNLVLIDFWAPWCGPCKMQTPILEKIAQSPDTKAKIVKINTDENPDIAQKFGISSIPTLVLLKGGTEIERLVGVQPESVLKQKITSQS
jgi:thioredoxin 1